MTQAKVTNSQTHPMDEELAELISLLEQGRKSDSSPILSSDPYPVQPKLNKRLEARRRAKEPQ